MKKGIKVISVLTLVLHIAALSVAVFVVLVGFFGILGGAVGGFIPAAEGEQAPFIALFEFLKAGASGEGATGTAVQSAYYYVFAVVLAVIVMNLSLVVAIYFGALTAMQATFAVKARYIEEPKEAKMAAPLSLVPGLLSIFTGREVSGILGVVGAILAFAYKKPAPKAEPEPTPAVEEVKEEPAEEPKEEPVKKAPAKKAPAKAAAKAPAKKAPAKKAAK